MGQDQLLGKIVTMACFDSGSHEFVPRAQSAGFGAVSQSLKGCTQLQHSLYSAPGETHCPKAQGSLYTGFCSFQACSKLFTDGKV